MPPVNSRVRQSRSRRKPDTQQINTNQGQVKQNAKEDHKREEEEKSKSFAKFQHHQNEAKQSIQRMLQELSDSSEEETDESMSRAENIQKAMRGDYSGDDSYYKKATQNLQTTCVVCLEKVRTKDSVWQCNQCYCLLHLTCTQLWAKSCFCEATGGNEDENGNWVCPKCRMEYPRKEIPRTYQCYCGKVENPPIDLWIVPHSVRTMKVSRVFLFMFFAFFFL